MPDDSRTIKATQGGNYTVKVSHGNCTSDISAPFDFKITTPVLQLLTELYPNPASKDFTLVLPVGVSQVWMELYDGVGKKMLERSTNGSGQEVVKEEFNLSHQKAGVFLLKIQTPDAMIVKKVVLR